MKKFIFSFLFVSLLIAQDNKIEQVYYTACDRAGIEIDKPIDFKPFDTGKCGFGLYVEVGRNWDKFSEIQKSNIKKSLERPQLQTSILSPSNSPLITSPAVANKIIEIVTTTNISKAFKAYLVLISDFKSFKNIAQMLLNNLPFHF